MHRLRRPRRRCRVLIIPYCLCTLLIFIYFINHDFNVPPCPYPSKITRHRIVFNDTSYSIHHYPEFVCPQNFRNLADWVYGWPETVFDEQLDDYFKINNRTIKYLPDGSIIYVKTDGVPSFFSNIYPFLQNTFVLITGQGGTQAPGDYIRYLEQPDSKIIHWFGQNGDIVAGRSNRFTHIPLGINCYEMAEGIRVVHHEYSNITLPSISDQSIDEPSDYIQPFDITQSILNNKRHLRKFVLLNFNLDTDPTGMRAKLWDSICKDKSSRFSVCFDKPDGVNIPSLAHIYRRNRQYPLWLSPRGTGLDCHRTWEALYLDIIPIVWHSTLDSLYENLPIIVIHDWDQINEKFLRNKLREISIKKIEQPSIYQYEKLRNAHWRDLIMSKSRYAATANDINRNRCWRAKTIERLRV